MRRSLGLAFILAIGLTACGGGGGGGSTSVVPAPGGVAPAAVSTKITILVPSAATTSQARSPKFIPTTTQSIRIHVLTVNGVAPDYTFFPDVILALSTANPECSVVSGGLSCTVTARVPQSAGVILQISAYTSTDGSGTPVAVVTTPPVNTTVANPVFTASLGGVPANILVSAPVISAPSDGAAHAITFNVWATTSTGELIIPPGTYPTPISVALSGGGTAFSLPVTSVIGPGATAGQTAVTVNYTGAVVPQAATVTLTSGSLAASVQIDILNISPTSLNNLFAAGASTSMSVFEPNNTGAFTLAGNGSFFTSTCVPSNCTPTTAGGTVTFNITPIASGTGSFTIKDTLSTPTVATIPFTITGQTGGGVTVSQYKIYEYTPIPPAGMRPYAITAGTDGKNVWFTDTSNSVVAAIDTTTCVTTGTPSCSINEFSQTQGVWGIAAGADGNMYVSTAPFQSTTGVTQIMTSVSGCPPACGSNFIGAYTATARGGEMVRASNGTVYVLDTAAGANNIIGVPGNATPPVYDQFLSSNATGNYNAIATTPVLPPGSTANVLIPPYIVWTDNASGDIVYGYYSCSDCSLTWQEYGGFNAGGFGGIVAAPNGTTYVIENGTNTIASFSPSACVEATLLCAPTQHYPIPSGVSTSSDRMAIGPDGNVWFTENAANKIGVLNVISGRISEISIPTSSAGPRGIALGPDGNMWFTEYNSGKIGEVVP